MTEKRFTTDYKGKYIPLHFFDNGEEMNPSDVSDLLNELSDDNEQLKHNLNLVREQVKSLNLRLDECRKER